MNAHMPTGLSVVSNDEHDRIAGVCEEFRNQGIAGLLLENLIAHFTSETFQVVKALYLHVLTTNSQAISFYEHR